MPHLNRECEDILRQAEKIAGFSDHEGQAVMPPQKRRSRHGPSQHADHVILSSKFVVESIRERMERDEDDPPEPPFWLEFPRTDAESLEKRGIEVLADPAERPPRKKITIVNVAEPASLTRIDFPQKRTAKGKIPAAEPPPVSNSSSLSSPNTGHFYHLSGKDFDWLDTYNNFCTAKQFSKITPHDLEAMMSSLDTKKNELVLAHLKSDISATNKTAEGTAKRHEKDYFVLQKFIAYTPNTFDQLDHLNLGRSYNLTTQSAFDIWEYWKLRLQDNFYQPIVFPPANIFDYRRISLLAAWNMTTVNYAQRLRHDAERIRLMYDLLQKRNHIVNKVTAREEELSYGLAELCTNQPETAAAGKNLSPDLLNLVLHYMHELSALNRPEPGHPVDHHSLRQWVESLLDGGGGGTGTVAAKTEEAAVAPSTSLAVPAQMLLPARVCFAPQSSKPVIFPPLELRPAPNIRLFHEETLKLGQRGRPRGRPTRSQELPKNLTFEHADNSCCENGPLDDDESLGRGAVSVKEEAAPEEEPLYMINTLEDSPGAGGGAVVLQEIYPALLKPSEFRTRLRSWKKTA